MNSREPPGGCNMTELTLPPSVTMEATAIVYAISSISHTDGSTMFSCSNINDEIYQSCKQKLATPPLGFNEPSSTISTFGTVSLKGAGGVCLFVTYCNSISSKNEMNKIFPLRRTRTRIRHLYQTKKAPLWERPNSHKQMVPS